MEFNGFESAMTVIGWLCAVVMVWVLLKQNKVFGEKIRFCAREIREYKQDLKEAENKQRRISAELQRMEDRAAAAEENEERLFRYLSELGGKAREPEPKPEELIRVLQVGLMQAITQADGAEPAADDEVSASRDVKKCIRKFRKDLSTGFIDTAVVILNTAVARIEDGESRERWLEILRMLRSEYAERLKKVIEPDGAESGKSAGGGENGI